MFNSDSRTSNSLKNSVIGGVSMIVKILLGFGYRAIFVYFLAAEYLGLNGLFSNILTILSLAELGITTSIVYRFYKPISENDVHYVGMLMNFFKRVYSIIALVVTGVGLVLLPFLPFLLNKTDTVPSDINLYVVYLLFLANTVSSYIFSYKLTLLTADQKNYVFSVIDLIINLSKYAIQIAILIISRNYTVTLAAGIVVVLLINFIASLWTTKQYSEVFKVKEMLPKEEQRKILKDTRACLYHKVGYTVLTGTDNAVLTKMVNLASTGLYSNYAMVLTYIQSFLTQILGNFTASVGNAIQQMKEDEYYKLFRKMTFLCLWISSVVIVCTYEAINDFICVWLGEKFLLDEITTIVLCIQLFITITRITNGAFINAGGLFVKDRIRPLIEAVLNLGISILLTYYFGIVGVFAGTIISCLLTTFWREPYLLYKHSFKRSVFEYWGTYLLFTLITVVVTVGLSYLKYLVALPQGNILWLLAECIVSFIVINLILFLVFHKREEYQYLLLVVKKLFSKLKVSAS